MNRFWGVLPIFFVAACGSVGGERIELSGEQQTRPLAVGAFDNVSLEGPDRVIIRVGGAPSVSATGDRAVLDRLQIAVENNKLVIERKGRGWNVSGPREVATVTVTVPRLTAASVGGSGDMTIDRVEGGDFAAAVGGSGDLRVGGIRAAKLAAAVGGSGNLQFDRVEAESVEMAIGGSGEIGAAGRAGAVAASIAGSGDVRAGSLQARTAKVSIAGSGNADVHASQSAEVAIMGSGDVTVQGGGACKTSKMGSGSVRCPA